MAYPLRSQGNAPDVDYPSKTDDAYWGEEDYEDDDDDAYSPNRSRRGKRNKAQQRRKGDQVLLSPVTPTPSYRSGEKVTDVSDHSLYGCGENFFKFPFNMKVIFDHVHEMETIKLVSREYDNQIYFDVRPNKLIPIRLELENPLPPIPASSYYSLRCELQGITHQLKLCKVKRMPKCKKCEGSISPIAVGEGKTWVVSEFDKLTCKFFLALGPDNVLHQKIHHIVQWTNRIDIPIKVACCTVQHDLAHFRILFVIERIDEGSDEPVLVTRMAMAPILSRKRAGKAPQARPPASQKSTAVDRRRPAVEHVRPARRKRSRNAYEDIPDMPAVMAVSDKISPFGAGVQAVTQGQDLSESVTRIVGETLGPAPTAVAPELMQTHNIDMALSNGFEQMPQPALMDSQTGPTPSKDEIARHLKTLDSLFSNNTPVSVDVLWGAIFPILACYSSKASSYHKLLMCDILDTSLSGEVNIEHFQAFRKWFGETSLWIGKELTLQLEILKPIAIRSWFHGFVSSHSAKSCLLNSSLAVGTFVVRFSQSRAEDNGLTVSTVSLYHNQVVVIEYPVRLDLNGECSMWVAFTRDKDTPKTDVVTKTYSSFDQLLDTCADVFNFGLKRYITPGKEALPLEYEFPTGVQAFSSHPQ